MTVDCTTSCTTCSCSSLDDALSNSVERGDTLWIYKNQQLALNHQLLSDRIPALIKAAPSNVNWPRIGCPPGGFAAFNISGNFTESLTITTLRFDRCASEALSIANVDSLVLRDLTVHNNTNDDGYAIVTISRCDSVEVDSVTVDNNEALQYGGAMLFASCGDVLVTRSSFIDNHVTSTSIYDGQGGALHVRFTRSLHVSASYFASNTAGQRAGGIYGRNVMTVLIEGSTFVANSGGDSGALAIQESIGNITIRNSTFDSNTNLVNGVGAVYIHAISVASATVTITDDVRFVNNVGVRSGALKIDNIDSNVYVGGTFELNRCSTAPCGQIAYVVQSDAVHISNVFVTRPATDAHAAVYGVGINGFKSALFFGSNVSICGGISPAVACYGSGPMPQRTSFSLNGDAQLYLVNQSSTGCNVVEYSCDSPIDCVCALTDAPTDAPSAAPTTPSPTPMPLAPDDGTTTSVPTTTSASPLSSTATSPTPPPAPPGDNGAVVAIIGAGLLVIVLLAFIVAYALLRSRRAQSHSAAAGKQLKRRRSSVSLATTASRRTRASSNVSPPHSPRAPLSRKGSRRTRMVTMSTAVPMTMVTSTSIGSSSGSNGNASFPSTFLRSPLQATNSVYGPAPPPPSVVNRSAPYDNAPHRSSYYDRVTTHREADGRAVSTTTPIYDSPALALGADTSNYETISSPLT